MSSIKLCCFQCCVYSNGSKKLLGKTAKTAKEEPIVRESSEKKEISQHETLEKQEEKETSEKNEKEESSAHERAEKEEGHIVTGKQIGRAHV